MAFRGLLKDWLTRLNQWWEYDHRLASIASKEWIRQEAERHPADRGECWR